MTLHPWPSNDGSNDPHPVIWKNGSALGLLADTLAVPLRFEGAGAEVSALAAAPIVEAADRPTRRHAALLRVRDFEARIGCAVT